VRTSALGDLESLTAHFAAAPVEGGLGVVPLEVRPGYVRARIPLGSSGLREDGRVSALVLAVAADCGLGVGVHSGVPGSAGGPTVEMRLDMAGSLAPATESLEVEGRAFDVGPVSGSGRVEMRDASGALVATAVGVMSIDRPAHAAAHESGPDLDARLDPDTVVVRPESPDGAVSAVRLVDGMRNSMGTVHGGVLAALADGAQEVFRDRAGVTRPLSLTVGYLRPAHVADRLLSCHSAFVRRGRRF
jgi:acyl-coenzyme A thioesterase PaaI-like protein